MTSLMCPIRKVKGQETMPHWEAFGMSNRPSLITRRNYVSELVVSSDLPFATISPILQPLSDTLTALVGNYLGKSSPFETTGFSLAFDNALTKQLYTPFIFQRLIETRSQRINTIRVLHLKHQTISSF